MRLENPLVGGAALAAWGFSLPRRLAPPGKREKKQNLALTYFSCRAGEGAGNGGIPLPWEAKAFDGLELPDRRSTNRLRDVYL